jgi:hypothetical protein
MELDPEGILRGTRWEGEKYLAPDWTRVVAFVSQWVERERVVHRLHELATCVRRLGTNHWNFPSDVVERCGARWEPMAHALEQVS